MFRIKLQLVFFLPSILSEKQPLFWLRVGTGCRRVSAQKLLRVYGKRGRGEGSVLYSSGTELANEIREFEYKLRRGHGEWDYGGVGKLFSFFFFYLRREGNPCKIDGSFFERGYRSTTGRKFWIGDVFPTLPFRSGFGTVNEVINEIFNKICEDIIRIQVDIGIYIDEDVISIKSSN